MSAASVTKWNVYPIRAWRALGIGGNRRVAITNLWDCLSLIAMTRTIHFREQALCAKGQTLHLVEARITVGT